jgi:uncharacterized linocin/CFP29 family protein
MSAIQGTGRQVRAAGLTVPLDSLGILEIEHERMDVFTPAEQSMSGTNRTQFDLPEKDFVFTPVPITHKDFQLEARAVMSSRRRGAPLDTTGLQLATRQVVEKLEDMVVNGGDINLNGNTIPGLATHADRNTHTISTAWDGVATNDLIIDDILAMIQLAEDDNMGGPFNLYYPKNYSTVFDEDYGDAVTTFPTTLRQRVEAISRVASVKQADVLADDNVLMVQMTSDVIDLPVAQEITTVDWETQGGWVTNFKVFAAMTVRVKSDKAGQSGVVHGSV